MYNTVGTMQATLDIRGNYLVFDTTKEKMPTDTNEWNQHTYLGEETIKTWHYECSNLTKKIEGANDFLYCIAETTPKYEDYPYIQYLRHTIKGSLVFLDDVDYITISNLNIRTKQRDLTIPTMQKIENWKQAARLIYTYDKLGDPKDNVDEGIGFFAEKIRTWIAAFLRAKDIPTTEKELPVENQIKNMVSKAEFNSIKYDPNPSTLKIFSVDIKSYYLLPKIDDKGNTIARELYLIRGLVPRLVGKIPLAKDIGVQELTKILIDNKILLFNNQTSLDEKDQRIYFELTPTGDERTYSELTKNGDKKIEELNALKIYPLAINIINPPQGNIKPNDPRSPKIQLIFLMKKEITKV